MPVVKKYYHDIDLDNNQLISAVIENRTSAPATAVDGQVYYNTVDKKIYSYNAGTSSWQEVGSGTVTSVALSAPTGFSVSGSPVTTNGTLALSFASGYALPTTSSQTNWDTAYGWGNHASAGYQLTSQKGVANGYASLDSGGKVPAAQLPSSLMEYKGVWNASTNTPTLVNGTGDTGDVYRVSVAGTQNLGSGSITYDIGDYVIYNGTAWEKSDTTDAVASVNGQTGVVTITLASLSGQPLSTNLTSLSNLSYVSASFVKMTAAGTFSLDTNTYLTSAVTTINFGTTGLTPASATSGAVSVAGTLVAANGGTGQSTYTIGDILYASASTTLSKLAAVAAGSYLRSAGTGTAPVWSTVTIPNAATLGDIWYGSAANTISALAGNTVNGRRFLRQTGTGAVSAAPAWDTILASDITGSALTKTDDTNVTLTLGGSPTTALLNAASLTLGWTGTLAVSRGGTGAGTLTGVLIGNGTSAVTAITGTASQVLRRNAGDTAYEFFTLTSLTNPMTTLGDIIYGGASGATTRLAGNITTAKQYLSQTGNGTTSAAPAWASIAGADVTGAALTSTNDTNVTVTLGGTPTTALLRAASLTLGWTGTLATGRGGTGLSTYVLGDIIYSSAANTLAALAGNITATKQFLSQTGTGAVSAAPAWATIAGSDITGAALTKTDDTNVTLTLGGTPTTALLRAASLTLGWTGQLAVSRGGTGAGTLTGVVIGNGTSAFTSISSTTALQVFRVNSAGTGYEFATLAAGGSVTTVSVVSANGFAGTVATASTTPAITLTTTITGLLKGNGTAISAAVAGTDYLTSNQTITLSGDISGSGTTAITTTIGANKVTNAMLAQVATGSFLGRVTAATGNVETLTGTQATTLLDLFSSTLKGLVPASGGGTTNFLRADGTWAAPAGGSGITTLNTLTATTQTFATGTTGTDFNISSATSTHTFNIPDAGASARGLVTTGTQTFAGSKIFNDSVTLGGNNSFSSSGTSGSSGSVTLSSFSSVGYKNSFTNNSSGFTLGNSSISATVGNVFNANASITAPSTGNTYGAVITVAVRSPQVTTSTGTLTNAVGLYISDAPTGATNNYAVWVDDGTVRLDAALELQGIPSATSANMLYYDTTTKRVTYGAAPSGSGSVSTVSVVSANGFAGTVATATTTPAITLTTTVTGILKGNGTAISAAIGNTDYLTATTPEYSGVLTTGTLTFVPANHFAALATATNSYNQLITQNSGSNPNSSNDIVVNNNLSTDATYYGDFGINSSNFSGTGSFNLANAVYLGAHTGDLVLGTFTSNAIHFVINAGNSDAATIKTTGQLQLPGYTTTSSFAGTAAGYLAFDSSGNIITVTAPTGGGGYTVTNQTTTYTATATSGTLIIKCDTTGGAFTVNLPTAVGNTATIIIKKTAGTAAVTVDANASETIDTGLTATINRVFESITLVSDNANWQIV